MVAVLGVAALLALLVSRRAPQHRPIAALLAFGLGIDGIRLAAMHWTLQMSERAGLALCLLVPPASAWAGLCAWRARVKALDVGAAAWAILGASVALLAPEPRAVWDAALPVAHGISVALQLWALLAFRLRHGPSTITQRCAGVLLAGDVAGLVGLVAREWVAGQGALTSLVLVAVQAHWYYNQLGGNTVKNNSRPVASNSWRCE